LLDSRPEDVTLASTPYDAEDDPDSREYLEKRLLLELKAQSLELGRQSLKLRQQYAPRLLWIVIGQVVAINVFFVCDGLRWLRVSDDLFKIFSASVFAEVIALALVVTRSLFPSKRNVVDDVGEFLKQGGTG
jgi:hypothetical protein